MHLDVCEVGADLHWLMSLQVQNTGNHKKRFFTLRCTHNHADTRDTRNTHPYKALSRFKTIRLV